MLLRNLILLACLLGSVFALEYKTLAGAPSEFAMHQLPTPSSAAEIQRSAMTLVDLEPRNARRTALLEKPHVGVDDNAGQSSTTVDLYADSKSLFMFTILSALNEPGKLHAKLTSPSGHNVPLEKHARTGGLPVSDGFDVAATTYVFEDPEIGAYSLELRTTGQESLSELQSQYGMRVQDSDVYVIAYNDNDVQIAGHLETYDLQLGAEMGVVATLTDEPGLTRAKIRELGKLPRSSKFVTVTDAEMMLMNPDGTRTTVPFTAPTDEEKRRRLGSDSLVAELDSVEPGLYNSLSTFVGLDEHGNTVKRSCQHAWRVVAEQLAINSADSSSVTARLVESFAYEVEDPSTADDGSPQSRITFDIAAKTTAPSQKFRAYAEVYGTDEATQEKVAVAWIGGMVDAVPVEDLDAVHFQSSFADDADSETVAEDVTLSLEFDLRWAELVNAVEPFELRNVVIQETGFNVPLAQASELSVEIDEHELTRMRSRRASLRAHREHRRAAGDESVDHITSEMRNGVKPARLAASMRRRTGEGKRGLVLSHGYCTDANPFDDPSLEGVWTGDYAFFLDPRAARSNDEFAVLLGEFGDSHFDSFGLIAHSQGGLASTHLLNYYWSGLTESEGERRIQSLGSPYLGNSAGNLMSLGDALGIGCGSTLDLSKDGAALWVTGITEETRKQVYYTTTQYDTGSLVNYCNLAVNLIVSWPNDGLAEHELSQLEGANYVEHVKGECHSIDMNFPPQTQNPTRDVALNALAAR